MERNPKKMKVEVTVEKIVNDDGIFLDQRIFIAGDQSGYTYRVGPIPESMVEAARKELLTTPIYTIKRMLARLSLELSTHSSRAYSASKRWDK